MKLKLEEEAVLYADRTIGFSNSLHSEWQACHIHIVRFCEESKWVQSEKIKAKIEVLEPFVNGMPLYEYPYNRIGKKILELKQQLEEL